MSFQTRLLTFYWQRLGYENYGLPSQCKHAERSAEGDPSAKLEAAGDFEQASARGPQEGPVDQT
jgi:hypothetical protein